MTVRRRDKALPREFLSYSLKQGCLVLVTLFKAGNPYPHNPLSIRLISRSQTSTQAKRIEDSLDWDCDLN